MAEPAVAPAPPAAPPPAPPATPPAAPPVLEKTPAEPKGYWPEDWQSRISKGDEKRAKDFSKFQSPEAIADAYVNLRGRMDRGESKPVLPKDAKPADIAAWRKDNGIPEAPEKYDLSGVEVPKEDAEIIGGFLKSAHGANFTPEQAKVAVSSYYSIIKSQEEAQATKDEEQRSAAIDTLAGEWGGKFSGYKNRIENFTTMFPEGMRADLLNARLPDGTALFNNVDFLKAVVAMSLKDIPDGVNVPAEGGDIGRGALDEYNALKKLMRENRKEYDRDPAKQARFGDLIDYLTKQELIDGQGNEIVKRRKAA